jgi:hypothetical protein
MVPVTVQQANPCVVEAPAPTAYAPAPAPVAEAPAPTVYAPAPQVSQTETSAQQQPYPDRQPAKYASTELQKN